MSVLRISDGKQMPSSFSMSNMVMSTGGELLVRCATSRSASFVEPSTLTSEGLEILSEHCSWHSLAKIDTKVIRLHALNAFHTLM